MKSAIGLGENKNVVEAIERFPFDDIVIAKTNKELLDYIEDPTVDGVIRGSLESNIIKDLRCKYPHIFRASVLQKDGHVFLLTPVGIDECDTKKAKRVIIEESAKVIEMMGIEPKIALISGGRRQDKGRSSKIDQSIDECEELTHEFEDKYDIKHYYILIEEAIKDQANIIIAPDGIIGNIIFRSLVLVSGITSYGALTLRQPNLFIDTSRSQTTQGYVNAIELISHLIDSKNK